MLPGIVWAKKWRRRLNLPEDRPFRLYRAVHTDPPTREDFTSAQALGIAPPNDDPEVVRTNNGISTFDSWERLSQQARRFRRIGSYMAEFVIPEGGPIIWERTFSRPGHYTVWGDPDYLLTLVTEVRPVKVE
jgi:hypothetical protein